MVDAPGEAEAMCAALNARGLVAAAHSQDSDTLLFGAETVYRRLDLFVTGSKAETAATVCRMSDVRRVLGIDAGGMSALIAAAQLIGGDYHLGGASNVGHASAFKVVKLLLRGRHDDSRVCGAARLKRCQFSAGCFLQHYTAQRTC